MKPYKATADFFIDEEIGAIRARYEDNRIIPLTKKPFQVLMYLRKNKGRTISVDEILDNVWPTNVVTRGSVKDYVAKIRKAFSEDKDGPKVIQTVRGLGYRFVGNIDDISEEKPDIAQRDADRASVVFYSVDECCLQSPLVSIAKKLANRFQLEIQIELLKFANLDVDEFSVSADQVWQKRTGIDHVGRVNQTAYVVTSSCLAAQGSWVTILVKVFNTFTGKILWGDVFDIESEKSYGHERNIPRKAAITIESIIRKDRKNSAACKAVEKLNAADHYALGLGMVSDSPESNLISRDHFMAAIHLVPNFVAAIAGYARTFSIEAVLNYSSEFESNLITAKVLLEKANSLNADDSRVFAEMGHVFSTLKEYDLAHSYFERSLNINGLDTDTLARYGWSLSFSGRADCGRKVIQRALDAHPYSPGWYTWNLGIASYLQGDYRLAYKSLKIFCAHRPNHPRPRRLLAVTSSKLGFVEEAENIVNRIVNNEPEASLSVESELGHKLIDDSRKVDEYLDHLYKAGLPS